MVSESEKNMSKELGLQLKKLREEAKLTQAEVATKAGISINYYARIERGEENPTWVKIEHIKKALGIKSLD
ncbi:MAG: anaerobic benzoate catabolism transcriptional regulator [bacterium ADurb.Bin212]|nr:MAG: anaerobic benzoate catabolism transcriptional regulator [bacterium ADurb.Bin212]